MLPRVVLRPAGRIAIQIAAVLSILALAFTLSIQLASAQGYQPYGGGRDRGQNEPGKFDFYVLALSWSPSYCEATRERGGSRPADQQCGPRPYAFVVHGLWPQFERGFPAFCQVPAPRLNRGIVDSMLELMPSPRLVYHEWDRHGTCSGLAPQAYFDNVRKARAAVKIPQAYDAIASTLTVAPGAVEEAFIKANPGLTRGGFAIACDSKRLSEVRICLNKDFGFRDCPEIARRSCRRDTIVMPPSRGGKQAGQTSDTDADAR